MDNDKTHYDMRTSELTAERERVVYQSRMGLVASVIAMLQRENEALRARLERR